MMKAILRFPEVKARTGLSRSTLYLKIAEGAFPRQVSLGPRAVGWVESEIEEWLSGQIEQSRRAAIPAAKRPPTLNREGECMLRETEAAGLGTAAASRSDYTRHSTTQPGYWTNRPTCPCCPARIERR